MQMSYLSRVVCLALCSAGLLLIVLELAALALSPWLLRVDSNNARRAEQRLFLVLLVTRVLPWLLVLCLLIPAYIHGEDNPFAERVGIVCLTCAACIFLVSLVGLARVLCAARAVRQCCRLCRAAGRSSNDLPLLLYPGERSLMAVAGVFFSRLIVSQTLLDPARFSSAAVEVALAHEAAHVRHRDNLKLLLLSLLPHIAAPTKSRASLQERWRLAAELAADEEGTRGEPGRSVLLAQLLVAIAREGTGGVPQGLVALLSGPEHLRVRVERLLAAPPAASPGAAGPGLPALLPLAGLASLLAALGYACLLFGHRAAEFLLHIG